MSESTKLIEKSRVEKLEDLLARARTQIRDLANYYPEKELFEAPSKTIRDIDELIGPDADYKNEVK